MHGFLSIEKKNVPWNKTDVEAYVTMASIGVIAGIVVAYGQTPLHWPGHKVLFWMVPVLSGRLLTKARAGASIGACTTIATTLLLGGRLAGGIVMMPLVVVSGVILDYAVIQAERLGRSLWTRILLLAAAGAAGNIVCFAKRLFEPIGAYFSSGNLQDLLSAASSYAVFGFVAGLIAAIVGYGILSLRTRAA